MCRVTDGMEEMVTHDTEVKGWKIIFFYSNSSKSCTKAIKNCSQWTHNLHIALPGWLCMVMNSLNLYTANHFIGEGQIRFPSWSSNPHINHTGRWLQLWSLSCVLFLDRRVAFMVRKPMGEFSFNNSSVVCLCLLMYRRPQVLLM